MTQINLIVAHAQNRVIGNKGAMPWHIPAELQHFKRLTMGCPVIMGRKTWDSIVQSLGKPLPGRQSIVVTRNPTWAAAGATVTHDLPSAIAACKDAPLAWMIGGAQLYAQSLPFVDECHVTQIDAAFEGDAWFPELTSDAWKIAFVSKVQQVKEQDLSYSYYTYHKVK